MHDGVGLVFESPVLPEISFVPFHTQQRRKTTTVTTKQAYQPKIGITMTVNIGRLRQAINNLPAFGATSDNERQEYISFVVVAALQDEISFKKVSTPTEHD